MFADLNINGYGEKVSEPNSLQGIMMTSKFGGNWHELFHEADSYCISGTLVLFCVNTAIILASFQS